MRRAQGFTLIELLIAMAVIAVALSPLILLQIQANDRHRRQMAQAERLTAQRNALALLRAVNPWVEPTGERDAGQAIRLDWTARPISDPRRSVRWLGGEGDWNIALYRVDARLTRSDGRPLGRFVIDRMGWEKRR